MDRAEKGAGNLAMPHVHVDEPIQFHRAFAIGIALNVTYIIIEVIFGLKADSLALD